MAFSGSTYTWNISDPSLIQKLKSAKPGVDFYSPVFSQYNLRWQLEIWPNGSSDDDDHRGAFEVYVNLVSLPPSIKQVEIRRIIQLTGTDIRHSNTYKISKEKMYALTWSKISGTSV